MNLLAIRKINYKNMNNKGFTLIELLVVIAIIGVLSSLIMTSFTKIQQKSRDTRRFEDLKTIQKAIEMYNSDKGHFPREKDGANGKVGQGAGIDAMIAPYIKGVVPKDPRSADSSYYYYYDGRQNCTDSNGNLKRVAVLFARNLETLDGSESRSACASWGGEGGAGASNSYMIVLGPTDG